MKYKNNRLWYIAIPDVTINNEYYLYSVYYKWTQICTLPPELVEWSNEREQKK